MAKDAPTSKSVKNVIKIASEAPRASAGALKSTPFSIKRPRIHANNKMACTITVSYTHLDVYKRQLYIWERMLVTDVRGIFLAITYKSCYNMLDC